MVDPPDILLTDSEEEEEEEFFQTREPIACKGPEKAPLLLPSNIELARCILNLTFFSSSNAGIKLRHQKGVNSTIFQ